MTKQIYTDAETDKALEKIKTLTPDFKLSNFVKEKILQEAGVQAKEKLNVEYIQERLASLQTQSSELQNQLRYFEGLKKTVQQKQKEQEIQEQQERERKEKKIDDQIETFAVSIKDFFEVNKKESIKLAKEFNEIWKENKNLTVFDFMKTKKYVEKPVLEAIPK